MSILFSDLYIAVTHFSGVVGQFFLIEFSFSLLVYITSKLSGRMLYVVIVMLTALMYHALQL